MAAEVEDGWPKLQGWRKWKGRRKKINSVFTYLSPFSFK